MKAILVATALLSSVSALAQQVTPSNVVLTDKDYLASPGAANLELKYGFRDLRFETDTAHIAGLKRLETGAGALYYRPTDSPLVGGARVSIRYGFVMGRLGVVELTASQPADGIRLLEALRDMYGQEDLLDHATRRLFPFLHTWTTQRVTLRYDVAADATAHASLVSTKLYDYYQTLLKKNRPTVKPGEL